LQNRNRRGRLSGENGGKAMIVAHSYLFVPAENREAYYKEHLEKVGIPSRKDHGCICYDYVFSASREDLMIIMEQWESEEDMAAHLASEHCKHSAGLRNKYQVTNRLDKFEVTEKE